MGWSITPQLATLDRTRPSACVVLTVAAAAGTSAPIAGAIAERFAELDRSSGVSPQP